MFIGGRHVRQWASRVLDPPHTVRLPFHRRGRGGGGGGCFVLRVFLLPAWMLDVAIGLAGKSYRVRVLRLGHFCCAPGLSASLYTRMLYWYESCEGVPWFFNGVGKFAGIMLEYTLNLPNYSGKNIVPGTYYGDGYIWYWGAVIHQVGHSCPLVTLTPTYPGT